MHSIEHNSQLQVQFHIGLLVTLILHKPYFLFKALIAS